MDLEMGLDMSLHMVLGVDLDMDLDMDIDLDIDTDLDMGLAISAISDKDPRRRSRERASPSNAVTTGGLRPFQRSAAQNPVKQGYWPKASPL